MRTVGVEEEFLLRDERHDDTRPTAAEVLRLAVGANAKRRTRTPGGELVKELKQQQLEANTAPHTAMVSLQHELAGWRRRAATAARRAGATLIASGTAPWPLSPLLVHTQRYDTMAARFGSIADEQLSCGCHVHVEVRSPEEAVGVLDRIRIWLPPLVALSSNSPFWQGRDTAFASYRSQMMGRWPAAGPIDLLGSAAAYRELIEALLATGVLLDEGMIYFDARCSARYSTVEIRVADVCLEVGDTVLVAALCRALVETAAREWADGVAPVRTPTVLVAFAKWQAAREGTTGFLLDPRTSEPTPAADVIADLVDHVRPALRAVGDEELVDQRVRQVLTRGTGAQAQRRVYRATGSLEAMLEMLAEQTIAGD